LFSISRINVGDQLAAEDSPMNHSEMKGSGSFREATRAETKEEARARASEIRRRQLGWIAAELPGEHPELALIAAQMLRFGGVKATRETILERLRATGRDQESLAAPLPDWPEPQA